MGDVQLSGQRVRDVLAVLTQRRGYDVPAEVLLELVWGQAATGLTTAAVHTVIARLRRQLGPGWLERGAAGYRLNVEVHLDADELEQLLPGPGRNAATGNGGSANDEAVARLRQAAALWRGPTAYAGVTDDLVSAERARLDATRVHLVEELAELLMTRSVGEAEESLDLAKGLISDHPLREKPCCIAMLAACRVGRQAEAFAEYTALRTRLRDELGVDPSRATQQVFAQVLRQGAEPATVGDERSVTACRADDIVDRAGAALGRAGFWIGTHRGNLDHARAATDLQSALCELDPATALAARLRVRLLAESTYRGTTVTELVESLAELRCFDDPVPLAEGLNLTIQCLLAPHHADQRRALIDELISLAPATGRSIDELLALFWHALDLLLRGSQRLGRGLRELDSRLRETHCPEIEYVRSMMDVTLAVRQGRLTIAEQLAHRCRAEGEAIGDPDAQAWYVTQLVSIRWLQCRVAEIPSLVEGLVDSVAVAEPAAGFHVVVAAFCGDADPGLARRALARMHADGGLSSLPRSSTWLATLMATCRAAHGMDDARTAEEVYELLSPWHGLPVVASVGIADFGSVDHALGLAAATMGRLDEAIGHLDACLAADLSYGNLPWRPLVMRQLATLFTLRAAPGDTERAESHRGRAFAEAAELAMDGWVLRWSCEDAQAGS